MMKLEERGAGSRMRRSSAAMFAGRSNAVGSRGKLEATSSASSRDLEFDSCALRDPSL